MVVGRETSGWNTKNNRNSISRIVAANSSNTLNKIIEESLERYSWHLLDKKNGNAKKTSQSWFKRFFLNVAKSLEIDSRALIYQNLYAWDFNGTSPTKRKNSEFKIIQDISVRLIATSIKFNKPDMIIFAVGCNKVNDQTIKKLCNEHLNGYISNEIIKGRYWRFVCDGIDCIRIAHPRAQNEEHSRYRAKAIQSAYEKFCLIPIIT